MQIAAMFLLPNGTFIVELVILFVILFLTTKFILPPLNRAMDERQADIRNSLEAAEAARADAAAGDDERKAILDEGRVKAREIVAEAQTAADEEKAAATARGQAEYDTIVSAADVEVNAARSKAITDAVPQLGTIVMGVVERVIGRQVDMAAHQGLLDEATDKLLSTAGSTS